MIRINLIPHRSQFRHKQIIEYITVLFASILLVAAIIVTIDIWSSQELSNLQNEKSALKLQNSLLSKKIGELRNLADLRKEVEGKLEIVDELQAGRFRALNTLDAIANAIPQNIWITMLRDKEGSIEVLGFGESSQAVANFMRALQLSKTFDDVSLSVDQSATVGGVDVRKFELSFRRLKLAEQSEVVAK